MKVEINGKEYILQNQEKVTRAIYGTVKANGKLEGGVGEGAAHEDLIAEYDKLGGLILKGKDKVRMGSFWDFDNNSKREKPEVVLEFRDIEGNEVLVDEEGEVPMSVKAAQVAKKGKKGKKKLEDDDE